MKKLDRRAFLHRGMQASLALGAAQLAGGCPAVPSPPSMPYEGSARVAAVKGSDLVQMARDALDAFGGIGEIVHAGETVFIKANFCAAGLVSHNSVISGDSTKPEIVFAVAEECLKAGAAHVAIGDAAQVAKYSWADLPTLDGSSTMAAEAERLNGIYGGRLTLACLNSESPAWDPVPSPWTCLGDIKVSSLITRADRVISIPVIKTHRWTQMTGSMKNFVGSTPVSDYGYGMPWRHRLHNAGIEQCFLDIVKAVKPDFALIDCSVGCEGNGPHVMEGVWGSTVDMRDRLGSWLLLAGTDPAATDATAARVIGLDPSGIKQLAMAYDQGIGQIQEDQIEILGERLDNLRVQWKPAEPTDGFWDILIPGIRMLIKS